MTHAPARSARSFVALGAVGLLALSAAGCSSSSSDSAASPTPTTPTAAPTTASPTSSPTNSDACSLESILAVLPQGSTMVRFDCASVAGTEWAAAEVEPGPTVFFLQQTQAGWEVSTSDQVCGTASAGLPPKLLDYCSSAGGSASPS